MIKNKKARSFVAIMVTVAVVAVFLRFSVAQLINLNIAQNESNAQDSLKLISTAIENYAKDHHGIFPTNLSLLTQSNPAYIDKEYIGVSYIKGYNYNCTSLEATGYTCQAEPARCGLSGKKIFTITTTGTLTTTECTEKEKE